MSTPRACTVAELSPNEWYVFVACAEHDWDFAHYQTFGPATTEDKAWDLLVDSVSNPGGGNVYRDVNMCEDDRREFRRMLTAQPPTNRNWMAPSW